MNRETLVIVGRISQIALRCVAIAVVISLARATRVEGLITLHDSGDVAREVKAQIQPGAKTVGVILKNVAGHDEAAKGIDGAAAVSEKDGRVAWHNTVRGQLN